MPPTGTSQGGGDRTGARAEGDAVPRLDFSSTAPFSSSLSLLVPQAMARRHQKGKFQTRRVEGGRQFPRGAHSPPPLNRCAFFMYRIYLSSSFPFTSFFFPCFGAERGAGVSRGCCVETCRVGRRSCQQGPPRPRGSRAYIENILAFSRSASVSASRYARERERMQKSCEKSRRPVCLRFCRECAHVSACLSGMAPTVAHNPLSSSPPPRYSRLPPTYPRTGRQL